MEKQKAKLIVYTLTKKVPYVEMSLANHLVGGFF